jgi:hypothetical protein
MKRLLLVLTVVMVGGGSVLGMSGAASEVKAAGAVKDADKAEVMVIATDGKDAKVAAANATDKISSVKVDTSTPENVYASIKVYTDAIVQKTSDEVERASIFEQLGTAIRIKHNKLAEIRNEYGRNALHVAAQHDDVFVTAVLLVAGILADSRDDQDNTAYDLASFYENTAVMGFYAGSGNGDEGTRRLVIDFAA